MMVGIPLRTNCPPLVAHLFFFLFSYERDFDRSLSDDTLADIIEACNLLSRYLDDLLNSQYHFFGGMVTRIYLIVLQ